MNRSVYGYSIGDDKNHFQKLQIAFNEVLNQLVDRLSLREKVLLSTLPEGKTSLLKRFLTFQVRCKLLDPWINKNPAIDYSVSSAEMLSYKSEVAEIIVQELCRKFRETCRLRMMK